MPSVVGLAKNARLAHCCKYQSKEVLNFAINTGRLTEVKVTATVYSVRKVGSDGSREIAVKVASHCVGIQLLCVPSDSTPQAPACCRRTHVW